MHSVTITVLIDNKSHANQRQSDYINNTFLKSVRAVLLPEEAS